MRRPRSRPAARRCSPTRARSLEEYWEYSRRIFEWADGGTPNMILDDGGDATLFVHLGLQAEKGDNAFLRHPTNEEEEALFALITSTLKEKPGWYRRARPQHQRRDRGNHDRRASALPDAQGRPPAVPGDQRQRLRDQVEIRQSLRLPREPGRRHPPRHRRDDGGQGRDGRGLRRRGQGLGRIAAQCRLPRDGRPRSIRSARCRRRWKATKSSRWTTRRRARTSSSPRPAMST